MTMTSHCGHLLQALLALCALLPMVMSQSDDGRPRLSIAAILPNNRYLAKPVAGSLRTSLEWGMLRKPRYRNLTDTYDINITPYYITPNFYEFSPGELMKFLCQDVLENHVTLLLYFLTEDKSGNSAITTDFLVKFADSIGLPVIAWLQDDNSGLAQVSVTTADQGWLLQVSVTTAQGWCRSV